jgi:hypothetical protein
MAFQAPPYVLLSALEQDVQHPSRVREKVGRHLIV